MTNVPEHVPCGRARLIHLWIPISTILRHERLLPYGVLLSSLYLCSTNCSGYLVLAWCFALQIGSKLPEEPSADHEGCCFLSMRGIQNVPHVGDLPYSAGLVGPDVLPEVLEQAAGQ